MNDEIQRHLQSASSESPGIRPVVRMRTPADMVDLLPYLLGFHPTDSIVALGLEGPRLRQGGTVRVDLPEDPSRWVDVAADVARCLVVLSEHRSRRPDAVIVYLCRDPAPGADGRSVSEGLRPLALQLRRAFAAHGVEVRQTLCVSAGRWWSYDCRPGCDHCAPEGTPVLRETTPPIAAAAAYAGIQVRGTLRELHDELAPIGGAAAEAQLQAFDWVAPQVVQELLEPGGGAAVRERTVELLRRALERFRGGPAELAPEESARLVLGLQDRLARDRAAEWLDPPDRAAAQRLWRYLARRCAGPYHPHAAAPLSLLGWTAWIGGDEVIARVSLGRALDADSEYTFAQLLYQAINTGADPAPLCRTIQQEREARERRRSTRRGGRERRGSRRSDAEPPKRVRCSDAIAQRALPRVPGQRPHQPHPSPGGSVGTGADGPPR